MSADTYPGFVDLQVNGALGIDFAAHDLDESGARRAAMAVLESGTAAFLPTLVSAPLEVYRRNLPLLAKLAADPVFEGRIAGIHLEGPFLGSDDRVLGVHRRAHVRAADPALLADLQAMARGNIRLLTIAAEIEGAAALTEAARGLGIAVSVGHSWSDAAALARVRAAGATGLTHFGNGVPRQLPRHDNPLIAGFACAGLTPMLIADGHHLPRDFVEAVLASRGPHGIVLVSDQSPAAGLAPGRHAVFGQEVELRADGLVWNPQGDHLAGSSACLMDGVNQALAWRLLDRDAAWHAAYEAPLALAGLRPGKWAATARVAWDAARGRFTALPAPGVL